MRRTRAGWMPTGLGVEDVAEQRALERVGPTREGVVRGAQWRGGAYRDGHLHSILRGEWRGAVAAPATPG